MISFTVDGVEYRAFNHLYAVSRCGKVLRKHRPYAPSTNLGEYVRVSKQLLHRVVAICWMPDFDPKKQIHHINGDKTDNRLENLECLTAREHLTERHAEMLVQLGKYERTKETREKLRQYRTGKVTSDETKAKQRAALVGRKRPFFTRAKHSEESRKRRGETHVRNTRCSVLGVEYRSFAAASEATGIHRFTIRKRCLSENFPDYKTLSSDVEPPTSESGAGARLRSTPTCSWFLVSGGRSYHRRANLPCELLPARWALGRLKFS